MIAAYIAALTLLQAGPKVVELPVKNATEVIVQAWIKGPDSNGDEMAAWQVLGEVLLSGTSEYTRGDLITYGSQSGRPAQVFVMPDMMRIQVAAPAENGLSVAAGLMSSIIRRPTLYEEDVLRAVKSLATGLDAPWSSVLIPYELPVSKVSRQDVLNVYARHFTPENCVLAISGPFESGQARELLAERFRDWRPKRTSGVSSRKPIGPRWTRREPISSLEMIMPAISPSSEKFGATVLATFALGVGKEGALHRLFREKLRWSYRQEAILWPTATGYRPRLLMAFKSGAEDEARFEQFKKELLADIETWTEEHRQRALAMAKSAITQGLKVSPFWLDLSGAVKPDQAGLCAWLGYHALIDAGDVAPSDMLVMMESVDLSALKEQVHNMIESARGAFVQGGKAG